MKHVRFKPFVGENYAKQDFKTMILGESHYNYEAPKSVEQLLEYDNPEETIGIVEEEGNPKPLITTFAVRTGSYNAEDYQKNIKDIVFYNFYQRLIGNLESENGTKDKSAFSPDYLPEAQEAFFEVIKEYKPDLVIAWGVTLLPEWMATDDRKSIEGVEDCWLYFYERQPDTKIWYINHPSMPMTGGREVWHEKYKEVLKLVGKK